MHRCFYGLEPDYEGVRLEMANSAWLVIGEEKWGQIGLVDYEFGRTPQSDALVEAYKSHLFDVLHTYGQLSEGWFSREKAQRLVGLCDELDLGFDVWTYHGNDTQVHNIWAGKENWQGGDEGSDFYHLDLLEKLGVQFLRIPPARDVFLGLADDRARRNPDRRAFHRLLRSVHSPGRGGVGQDAGALRDAQGRRPTVLSGRRQVLPAFREVAAQDNLWLPPALHVQFGQDVLDHIAGNRLNVLMNQHLTTFRAVYAYDYAACRDTLRLLSDYNDAQRVLVTSPSRLLWFEKVRDALADSHELEISGRKAVLRLPASIDGMWGSVEITEDLLQGIAFEVPDVDEIIVLLGSRHLDGLHHEREGGVVRGYYPWHSRVDEQAAALDVLCAAVRR